MKRMLLLVFIGLGFVCSKIQAQSNEYIFPQNKEYVGYYSGGSLSYQNGNLKATANSYLSLGASGSFWSGCTNYVWYVNLPGGAYTFYGSSCGVRLTGSGWGMITVDAIDKDGRRHRNASFSLEVTN